jgi:ATP-binding cassette subfamily B protein
VLGIDQTLDHTDSPSNPPLAGFRDQWRERAKALRHLPTVFSVIWEAAAPFVVFGLILRAVSACLPLGLLAVTKMIIDSVAGVASGKPLPHAFWWWVALEITLAVCAAILGRTNWYVDTVLADRFSHALSLRVMAHAAELNLEQYENAGFHDKLERARLQATDRAPLIAALGLLIQQTFTAVSLCIGIAWYSPWLLAILALCLFPAFAGESHYAFLGYSLAISQTPTRRRLDYLRILGASKESAKELKLFSLSRFFTNQFRDLSDILFQQNRRLWRRRLFSGAALSLVTASGYYGAYIYVVYRAVHGEISVGTLTFLTGAIGGASSSLQSIFSTFSNIADQTLFLTALSDFFQVRPVLPVSPVALPAPNPILEGIRFENVGFHYPGADRPVLQNFNLHLAPGDRVALVGENGQGKTTIIKLLTRLYDPTSGRILLDGIDLREYDPQSLFAQFSVLFQDFMEYDMEVHGNIGVGRIDLTGPDRDRLIARAADRSGAREVIDRLPGKMNQMLGRRFDGGVDLSGGEWQKVALARAYLRDAQIYVLDEPTAALDARSEFEVFERFAELTRGKMAVLISHRFSTVKMVDRILVLKDGRIFEQGSHEQLLAHGGLYASLFELQASSYR